MKIVLNGQSCPVADGLTLAELVGQLVSTHEGVAVAVDGAVAPKSTWTRIVLSDGQRVELLAAVAGG